MSETKTYRGRSLDELLVEIRAELGPDAVIVARREETEGGVGGFFARRVIELDARPAGARVDVVADEAAEPPRDGEEVLENGDLVARDTRDEASSFEKHLQVLLGATTGNATPSTHVAADGDEQPKPTPFERSEAAASAAWASAWVPDLAPPPPPHDDPFEIDGAADVFTPDARSEHAETPIEPEQRQADPEPEAIEAEAEAIEPEPEAIEAEPEPEPEPEPELEPEVEPEAIVPEPEPEPEAIVPEVEPGPEPEAIEPEPEPEAIEPEPEPEPEVEPEAIVPVPEPEPEPVVREAEPEPEAIAPEPEPEAEPEPEPEAIEPEPEPEPEPEAIAPEPEPVAPDPAPVAPEPVVEQVQDTPEEEAVMEEVVHEETVIAEAQEPVEPAPSPEPTPEPTPAPEPVAVEPVADLTEANAMAAIETLTRAGVGAEIARSVVQETVTHLAPFAQAPSLKSLTQRTLAARIPVHVTRGVGGLVTGFIGPGGAGKTQCVARLATAYAARSALPVAVVTLRAKDGGAELRELLAGTDVEVYAEDLAGAAARRIGELRASAMVVLDTPGVSPRAETELRALATELAQLHVDELHLTVPATIAPRAARELVAGARILRPSAIAITHQDETDAIGTVVDLAIETCLPLSFIGRGQSAQTGLRRADAVELAHALMP